MKKLQQNFIYPVIPESSYHFGAGEDKGPVINEAGDWRKFTPPEEYQNKNGVESSACFVEAQQHALATIQEKQYGIVDQNYSSRFNLIFSDATPTGGDPLKAAQTFRDKGLVPESMLPFSDDIKTWSEFNSFKGGDKEACLAKGIEWRTKWEPTYYIVVRREYDIETKYRNLKEALKYSPCPVSVAQDYDNGLPKPQGVRDIHLVELVYIDEKNRPYVFDTYSPFLKRLAPFYDFEFGLREKLDMRNDNEQKIYATNWLIDMLMRIFPFLQKKEEIKPVPIQPKPIEVKPVPKMTNLEKMYQAAKNSLGKEITPNDVAPDEYACMEGVDTVKKLATGSYIAGKYPTVSTAVGYKLLKASPDFQEVYMPEKGCIIISPTVGSNTGHTGICGIHGIMSNNSPTGTFEQNYTYEAWDRYFRLKKGLKVYYFKIKN